MGACTSSPRAETAQGVETNQSPIHAETTQVKEKMSSDDSTDSLPPPATSSTDPLLSDQPTTSTDVEPSPAPEKAAEETKEAGTEVAPSAERRPSTASQKTSARGVTPRTVAASATPAASSTEPSIPVSDSSAFASSSPSDFNSVDSEFRQTVKTVLVLLLDRFTRTLEFEKAAFQELAVAVGYGNYMQLFDYEAFEVFLRRHYVIPSSPAPHKDDTDLRYLSQYFALFLSLAQHAPANSSGGRTLSSREELTVELQRLCCDTSAQLLKWCQSAGATVEVKEHMVFFSKALEFTRGDLVHNPQLLYKNIDDICE